MGERRLSETSWVVVAVLVGGSTECGCGCMLVAVGGSDEKLIAMVWPWSSALCISRRPMGRERMFAWPFARAAWAPPEGALLTSPVLPLQLGAKAPSDPAAGNRLTHRWTACPTAALRLSLSKARPLELGHKGDQAPYGETNEIPALAARQGSQDASAAGVDPPRQLRRNDVRPSVRALRRHGMGGPDPWYSCRRHLPSGRHCTVEGLRLSTFNEEGQEVD